MSWRIHTSLERFDADAADCVDEALALFAFAQVHTQNAVNGFRNFGVRNAYTENIDNWVASHAGLQTDRLLPLAHRVIDRIVGPDSELPELWEDSDSFSEWQASIEDLRSRLK